jgi:hypothetical protein
MLTGAKQYFLDYKYQIHVKCQGAIAIKWILTIDISNVLDDRQLKIVAAAKPI